MAKTGKQCVPARGPLSGKECGSVMMWDHGAWNTTKYSHHYWFQRLDFYEHQWWASQKETQFSFEDQHGIHPLLLGVKSHVKQGPLTNHGNGLQVLEEEQIPQSQEIQSASLINFLSSKDQCFSWTLEFTTVPDTIHLRLLGTAHRHLGVGSP